MHDVLNLCSALALSETRLYFVHGPFYCRNGTLHRMQQTEGLDDVVSLAWHSQTTSTQWQHLADLIVRSEYAQNVVARSSA